MKNDVDDIQTTLKKIEIFSGRYDLKLPFRDQNLKNNNNIYLYCRYFNSTRTKLGKQIHPLLILHIILQISLHK